MTVMGQPAALPKFDPAVDYYALLQVHPRAHAEVIKRAYRAILGVLGAHPDLGGAHDHAVRLNEAYAVLSNPDSRRAYDAARRRLTMCARLTKRPHHNEHAAHHRVIRCPRCGAKNRLPAGTDLAFAVCGKCRSLLAGW
ncbi:MAG: chaperone protein DnaJ [bacterium ADurb.Bin429]|nr:MAG: chaperone protein DnaJ [bacterium ADurb.Bin429]